MNPTLIILIPGFPSDEADSTCVPFPQAFIRNLKLLDPGLNIIVFALQYPFFVSEYEWNGVHVYSFGGRNRGKLHRLLLWRNVIRKLKTTISGNNVIGILNFWLGECALISKYISKKYSIRSFTWMMGQDARKGNRFIRYVKPEAGELIALSDFLREEFYSNYGIQPAHTVPLAIDTTMFPLPVPQREIDVLGAGSLIPLKQYDHFVRIISDLKTNHPTIKAIICGDGPDRKKLERMIADKNLSDNINLTGEIDHTAVLKLMQSSKVFLHPSSFEGFGGVCSEALYAGAHVVSFCRPMNRVFNHAHIVRSENEMKDKVSDLLNAPRLNHDRVATYSIEETCRKIISLYS